MTQWSYCYAIDPAELDRTVCRVLKELQGERPEAIAVDGKTVRSTRPRITSYNVCYTKLLRNAELTAVFALKTETLPKLNLSMSHAGAAMIPATWVPCPNGSAETSTASSTGSTGRGSNSVLPYREASSNRRGSCGPERSGSASRSGPR